jgi:hypothetical protein
MMALEFKTREMGHLTSYENENASYPGIPKL